METLNAATDAHPDSDLEAHTAWAASMSMMLSCKVHSLKAARDVMLNATALQELVDEATFYSMHFDGMKPKALQACNLNDLNAFLIEILQIRPDPSTIKIPGVRRTLEFGADALTKAIVHCWSDVTCCPGLRWLPTTPQNVHCRVVDRMK